jgi:ribosomal-protein-alanine N-acetyltransferase
MNHEVFSLRPATLEDLSGVVTIEKQVHVAPWTEEHFRLELEKPYSHFLVLTDDETDTLVAGYIVCWGILEEYQILNLATAVEYRGLGFAKEMIQKIISLACRAGVQRIVLDVRKTNSPAIQLYQQMNFNIIHVRKAFYSDGEDGYHMSLILNGKGLSDEIAGS